MGRKGVKRKGSESASGSHQRPSITLREESTGKREKNVNAKTMCKIDHLKNIAMWTATEVCVPSLGAFFGQLLAASTEEVGIRSDPNLFTCERCETILQPGHNSTVRIEKNRLKKKRNRNRSKITSQNSVVYTCHFCSHRNIMRGTPKGHVKAIAPPKAKQPPIFDPNKHVDEPASSFPPSTPIVSEARKMETVSLPITDANELEPTSPRTPFPTTGLSFQDSERRKKQMESSSSMFTTVLPEATPTVPNKVDAVSVPATSVQNLEPNSPVTPFPNTGPLLDSKRRTRNRKGTKKVMETANSSARTDVESSKCNSNKRRRKSWTTLEDIALNSAHKRDSAMKLSNSMFTSFCK